MEIAFAEVLFLLNSACLLEPTACVHAAHPTHYRLSRALLLLPSATTHVHVLAVKPKVWDHYILELEPCTARFVGITPADWRGALDSVSLMLYAKPASPYTRTGHVSDRGRRSSAFHQDRSRGGAQAAGNVRSGRVAAPAA